MKGQFMSNHKKIVITGASGFLGSHLLKRLKNNESYMVYALSSKHNDLKEKIGGDNVEYIHKDALNGEIIRDSIVVNCAYPRNSTGTAIADGLKYIQKVFEAAVEGDAAAIINISSQSVYSQQRTEAATEETPVCLESPYAVGKYAVELMLGSICKKSKTSYTSLRMASLIGPGFDQRIVNRLAMKLMKQETITVVRQNKKMGFLDVEDAVNAIMAISKTPLSSWKSIYNIGNGIGYTTEEIYNAVASELSNRIEISNPLFEMGADETSTAVSFEKLKKDTGFVPTIDLNESVKRIVDQICGLQVG